MKKIFFAFSLLFLGLNWTFCQEPDSASYQLEYEFQSYDQVKMDSLFHANCLVFSKHLKNYKNVVVVMGKSPHELELKRYKVKNRKKSMKIDLGIADERLFNLEVFLEDGKGKKKKIKHKNVSNL